MFKTNVSSALVAMTMLLNPVVAEARDVVVGDVAVCEASTSAKDAKRLAVDSTLGDILDIQPSPASLPLSFPGMDALTIFVCR